ncbi:DUF11 domain-containing protein [Fretibacter rubidus]|uniref:DUF11 domain-containing protein n=1 Tax=Fretibacter rubidus TaxID=570162 RepID=UPI00352A92C9
MVPLKLMETRNFKSRISRALGLMASLCLIVPLATAQSYQITGNPADVINGTIDCGGTSRLTRTINVPTSFTVDKLNLGFVAAHSWRGDIELTLTPPDGAPTVQLIDSETNTTNQDNYNVELDNDATTLINTAPHDTNDSLTFPPASTTYENRVQPNGVSGAGTGLDAFSGEAAAGNWTLSMCDAFPGSDDGTFEAATLYFIDASAIDLSMAIAPSSTTPDYGTSVNLAYTITNSGAATATGVTADIILPSGLDFVSSTGAGSYNDTTGVWTVPNITAGNSQTITISATVLTSGGYTTTAEVSTATETDIDSTPANANVTEDDYDSETLSPVSVSIPPLACPIGQQSSHIWTAPGGANGWTGPSLSESYTLPNGEALAFTISGDTGTFIPRGGVTIPATTDEFTGGSGSGIFGLTLYVDFTSPSQSIIVDIDVGAPGIGMGDVQFGVYDVDLGGWTDRIAIEGFLDTIPKTPIITASSGNTVVGNAIVGTGGSGSTQGNGNSTFTFGSSVDRIRMTYDNTNPAANPDLQVIAIMPFTFCPPFTADLSAQKTVEMYDPSGTGATDIYAIPGNEVLYKISVTNSATATAPANDINLNDVLPGNLRFVSASVTGFSGGSFGSPALPATNTDCDGGACVINYTGADLPVNTTGEIAIRAVVK